MTPRSVRNEGRALRAILFGTLAVGVLDGGFVVIRVALNGGSVLRPFQVIAAGLLGRSAYDNPGSSAVLGLTLHFLIAAGVVVTYFLASRFAPLLVRRPVICGALFGLAVYVVMYHVVIPLSALTLPARTMAQILPAIAIHVCGVGIPAALAAAAAPPGQPKR